MPEYNYFHDYLNTRRQLEKAAKSIEELNTECGRLREEVEIYKQELEIAQAEIHRLSRD